MRGRGEIGSSFDAKINLLTNNPGRYTIFHSLKDDLCEIFRVSEVEIIKEKALGNGLIKASIFSDIAISVVRAEGGKCVRCWNYSPSVGHHMAHPLICWKCLVAIGGK